MSKEKISSLSICVLLFSITQASFLGIGFHYVFVNQQPIAILNVIFGIILGYGIITIYLKVMNSHQSLSFSEKINKVFKRPFNYIINFISIITVLIGSMLGFWRIVDFLASQYLSKTPTLVIGLLLISLVFYTLLKNIEVLTRYATIIFAIALCMIAINIFALVPEFDINNLKPFYFDNCAFKMIKSSIYFALLFVGPCFFLLMMPKNNITDKDRFNKMFYIFYTISGVILFFIFLFILACLGLDIINLYKYPAYIVLKKITVFEFIESIENFTFILWYLYLHLLCTTGLLFVKNSVLSIFKLKISTKKSFVIALILSFITLFVPYFIFNNNYHLTITLTEKLPIILDIIVVSIALFYLIVYKIKNSSH